MTSRCRGCGAEVIWMKTPMKRKIPVDAEPVWIIVGCPGRKTFIKKDGGFIFGLKVGDAFDDQDPEIELAECYESHVATGPVGAEFRNRAPRTRAPGYR